MIRSDIYEKLGRQAITAEALEKVMGDRARDYGGSVLANLELTARLWEPVLRCEVTAEQVALCMVQLKVARLLYAVGHRDSQVDVAGWIECLALALAERELADGRRQEEAEAQDRAEAELEAEIKAGPPQRTLRCPNCGVERTQELPGFMVTGHYAIRCETCGKIASVAEWIKGPQQSAGEPERWPPDPPQCLVNTRVRVLDGNRYAGRQGKVIQIADAGRPPYALVILDGERGPRGFEFEDLAPTKEVPA